VTSITAAQALRSLRLDMGLNTFPRSLRAFVVLVIAAGLIRLPHFGDPAYMIDEQFYLLGGDRLLHGALPYVDFWDRKPIGLFLIYAAIRLLGGAGFWQYQIVASLFAAATAFVIYRIGRRIAADTGALIAGLLYLLWIELTEGGGGQAPVFYNLFVAGAACAVLRAGDSTDPKKFARMSFAAMALAGIAIQVKYTAAAEGLCFGLLLSGWTLSRLPARMALPRILLLAMTASAPTVAVFAFYAALGQAQPFWFANFSSILLRAPTPLGEIQYRTQMLLFYLCPSALCIVVGLVQIRHDRSAETRRWRWTMLAWCSASLVGLFGIGTLYSHYLLPVFVPFMAASTPALGRRPVGPALAIFTALLPLHAMQWPDFARAAHHRTQVANIVRLIPPEVDTGCLQMFDGPPVLAYLTKACSLSRFVFPDHLSAFSEARAIGVDPATELRHLLSLRPLAITIGESDVRAPNRATFAIMRAALTRDYRLAGRSPFDGRLIDVYVRKNPR